MKQVEIKKLIADTAQETVKAIRRESGRNYYRATERMLFAYKKLAARLANKDEYMQLAGRSKDITIAPSASSRDRADAIDAALRDREISYMRTQAQYDELYDIIKQFESDPRFIVIRMYYFNEDAQGNDRAEDAQRMTFDEIAYELGRNENTVRNWRTKLVQEITVQLFGLEGALSLESFSATKFEKMVAENFATPENAAVEKIVLKKMGGQVENP